tara:strand:- start:27026 stop:28342 length:1317 start_codon:yes stop_codon:yes gene_type:complete
MSKTELNPSVRTCSLAFDGALSGLQMRVHDTTDVHLSETIASTGLWEPMETALLLKLLRPGQVFLDVGANIGYFTLLASRLVGPTGQVLAFEPEALNFDLLQQNCHMNHCDNVHAFAAALGTAAATGKIYLNELNKGDHSIVPGESDRASQDIEILNGTHAISPLCQRLDFVKIDTQGYECEVLRGLLPLLQASADQLRMIIEFSPLHLHSAGASARDLLDLVEQTGAMNLYVMDDHSGGLLRMSRGELESLASLSLNDPATGGYANLVVSSAPLEDEPQLHCVRDLGMYESALSYLLLASRLQSWDGTRCAASDFDRVFYLPQGWSLQEDWGRWSLGKTSRLKFVPATQLAVAPAAALHIRGRYYAGGELTAVEINGQAIGSYDLSDCKLPLPPECLHASAVTIGFGHHEPVSPASIGDGDDMREIKFGLESLEIVT